MAIKYQTNRSLWIFMISNYVPERCGLIDKWHIVMKLVGMEFVDCRKYDDNEATFRRNN